MKEEEEEKKKKLSKNNDQGRDKAMAVQKIFQKERYPQETVSIA
jgi:hypothetical protein